KRFQLIINKMSASHGFMCAAVFSNGSGAMSIHVEVLTLNQQRQEVFTHSPVNIGRGANSCLRLQGWRVGVNHARLYVEGVHLFIEDLGSLQGTVVNNERIKYFGPVQPQDQILIGPYRLHLRMQKETQLASKNSIKEPTGLEAFSAASKVRSVTKNKSAEPQEQEAPQVKSTQDNHQSPGNRLLGPCTYSLLHKQYRQHQELINQLREHVLKEMNLREMVAINVSQENIKKRVEQVAKKALESKNYEYSMSLSRPMLLDFVLADICGLGPLEPLLADSEISE